MALITKIKEYRYNFKLSEQKHSVLITHSTSNDHKIDLIDTKILVIESRCHVKLI